MFSVSRRMADNELWSFTNALAFVLLLVCIALTCLFGFSTIINITHIKADWANQRCNPAIMPFASYFGHDTGENFNFCMGKIFNSHAGSYMGSFTSIFSKFTGLLSGIFDSINSLRNVIASLGGGINVVFQEFTDRITMFFFTLRVNAMRLKMMFGRLYAILFSIMYMGMSGITGMTSFTNTFLFSFLDTFCFPGDTLLSVKMGDTVKRVPIKEVKIGDILLPGNTRVTATFSFYARGQPMVKLGSTVVSTNHYVMHQRKAIKAGDHPHAIQLGGWDSDDHLYCLNTDTHIIPVGLLEFIDYDETSEGDQETMRMIEERVNGIPSDSVPYLFTECGFGLAEDQKIRTTSGLKAMRDICIGDKLSTGSEVVGVIRKEVSEICNVLGMTVTPSTLYWDTKEWVRFGERIDIQKVQMECISLVVTPNSQIELENGLHVRDYMELCSPDAEIHYTKHLLSCNIK